MLRALVGSITLLTACSSIDVDSIAWRCSLDADCGRGWVCQASTRRCVKADSDGRNGISDQEIVFAVALPLTAGDTDRGEAFRQGLSAAFAQTNSAGGVFGRQLVLTPLDDADDPDVGAELVRAVVGDRSALAVLGGLRTDVARSMASAAAEAEVVFLAQATGQSLRPEAPERFLFTVWPGDGPELSAALTHLRATAGLTATNVAVFGQGALGLPDAGTTSIADATSVALAAFDPPRVFVPEAADTEPAVNSALAWLADPDRDPDAAGDVPTAFVLAGPAGRSAAFVDGVLAAWAAVRRDPAITEAFGLDAQHIERLRAVARPRFVAPSTVGPDLLAARLANLDPVDIGDGVPTTACAGVLLVSPVPAAGGESIAAVDYREALAAHVPGAVHGSTSFQAWLTAQVLVNALQAQGESVQADAVRERLEATDLSVGTGSALTLSSDRHVASATVHGFELDGACLPVTVVLRDTPDPPPQGCPDGLCRLTGTLANDQTLTADQRWLLVGPVLVGEGATLTIEPGTTVLGDADSGGMLVVRRGARIQADGTRDAPVIFTSSRAPGERAAGDWGGVVINGRAPVNGCAEPPCERAGEGSTGLYGGDDPEDDSGRLRYVRIEFAGRILSRDDELNGLSLQGVGRGTTIQHVQVHRARDDGLQVFGGTVDLRHILITGAEDDGLEWDYGWRGRAQFLVVQHWPGFGHRGIEGHNDPDARNAEPRSLPVLTNVTLVGRPDGEATDGVHLSDGTGAWLNGVVTTGFAGGCLDIDHPETFAAAAEGEGLSGLLRFEHSIFSCAPPFVVDDEDADQPFSVPDFVNGLNDGNRLVAPGLIDPTRTGAPDFRPTPDAPAATGGLTPDDAAFEVVDYVGAMSPDAAWTDGWVTGAPD